MARLAFAAGSSVTGVTIMTSMARLVSREAQRLLVQILSALLAILAYLPGPLLAAPGDLDPSFGSGGKVITDFGGEDVALTLLRQSDGKIIVAGTSFVYGSGTGGNFALARYNPDGSLDPTFGTGGKATSDLISNGSDEVHASPSSQTAR